MRCIQCVDGVVECVNFYFERKGGEVVIECLLCHYVVE